MRREKYDKEKVKWEALWFVVLTIYLGAINSKRMRYAGRGKHMGKKKNADRVSVVKHDDKSPLGRSTPSCEYNIKIDFQRIE